MRNSQKGFGALGVLLLILAIGLVAAVGWSVHNQQKPSETVTTTQSITYKEVMDSSGSFSLSHPETWQMKPYVWDGDCCHGNPIAEPDWSKESQPITLHPAGDSEVEVTVRAEKYGVYWDSYEQLKASVKKDYFAKVLFDGVRDDGHEALFTRVDYLGPPDAKVESFTDHRYYFDYGDSVLKVEFREKYHHDWPDDEMPPDIDNSKYLPDFEHIANSVKFLD